MTSEFYARLRSEMNKIECRGCGELSNSSMDHRSSRFCETCNSYKSLNDYMDHGIMSIGALLVYHDEVL